MGIHHSTAAAAGGGGGGGSVGPPRHAPMRSPLCYDRIHKASLSICRAPLDQPRCAGPPGSIGSPRRWRTAGGGCLFDAVLARLNAHHTRRRPLRLLTAAVAPPPPPPPLLSTRHPPLLLPCVESTCRLLNTLDCVYTAAAWVGWGSAPTAAMRGMRAWRWPGAPTLWRRSRCAGGGSRALVMWLQPRGW